MSVPARQPFFSVLIPSYNRPEYLPQAVASVLANDEADFELIISDDCSPRQSEIIQALTPFASDSRLIFEPQPKNLGEARNRHFLMRRARGAYRLILGDDDLLAPHALATLRSAIVRQPDFDLYLFGYSIIDEDGRIFETRHALASLEISLSQSKIAQEVFHSDIFPFWFYHPATFCFTAVLHDEVVPNHSIGIGDDLIFLFDALLAGKRLLVMPGILFSYRKFIGPRIYGQANLSQTHLANVITRRHIYYNLIARDRLPSPFNEFIHSRAFRERFLYNAIVTDADTTAETVRQLDLLPTHLAEAQNYQRFRRRPWFRHWLQLQRIARFASYFGFSALIESANVFWQRRSYRRNIINSLTR